MKKKVEITLENPDEKLSGVLDFYDGIHVVVDDVDFDVIVPPEMTTQVMELLSEHFGGNSASSSDETIVVSRHDGFVKFLEEKGVITEGKFVRIPHVENEEQIRGKVVISSGLPLRLASTAKKVITVDLELPPSERGKELTKEKVKQYFRGISEYKVEKIGGD